MITMKQFFTDVLVKFEAEIISHNNKLSNWRTNGICYSIYRVADAYDMEYDSPMVLDAITLLNTHTPINPRGAYWFPVKRAFFTHDECVTPRLEILNKIIASL